MKTRLLIVNFAAAAFALSLSSLLAAAPLPTAPLTVAQSVNSLGRGQGGLLRIIYWQAPTILNAHLAQGTKDSDAARPILEPLASIAPDGSLSPVLAADVPTVANGGISSNHLMITWTLQAGLKWSDGQDVTSDDLLFTYNYCANVQTGCTTASAFSNVAIFEQVNTTTVRITWQFPNFDPYQMFVGTNGYILPLHQFSGCIGVNAHSAPACQAANLAPIGTGPYKLDQFIPGDVVTYTVNPNYRDPDKPFFGTVRLKGGGDANSAAQAVLRDGQADYAWNLQVTPALLLQYLAAGKGALLTVPSPNLERLLLNRANPDPALGIQRSEPSQTHPFLSDPAVRQALALAVDRQQIADLYGPFGSPTCEMVVNLPYISPTAIYGGRNPCASSLVTASQMLTDAGWLMGNDGVRQKNSVRMHILYRTTINALRQQEQADIKARWQAIGVETEITSTQAGVFFSSDPSNPDTAAHFFADVEMFTNGSAGPDHTTYLCGWTTAQIAQSSNSWSRANVERYSNASYDQLCTQLKAETDPTIRNTLVLSMNDILVQDVVDIPLVARHGVSGYAKHLIGMNPTPWDSELWNIADWAANYQDYLPLVVR